MTKMARWYVDMDAQTLKTLAESIGIQVCADACVSDGQGASEGWALIAFRDSQDSEIFHTYMEEVYPESVPD